MSENDVPCTLFHVHYSTYIVVCGEKTGLVLTRSRISCRLQQCTQCQARGWVLCVSHVVGGPKKVCVIAYKEPVYLQPYSLLDNDVIFLVFCILLVFTTL